MFLRDLPIDIGPARRELGYVPRSLDRGLRETIDWLARRGDGMGGAGGANAGQIGLSVLAHFGRPMTETFAAIPGGFLFGWISLRTGSIWYVALIHWTVGTSMDWFILVGAG